MKQQPINIDPKHTVGQVKHLLKQNNLSDVRHLYFNNNTMLDFAVFDTNAYDNVTFEAYAAVLPGSYVLYSTLENLPKDLLRKIALDLNIHDVFNYCVTSKNFSKICNDRNFWISRLNTDFNIIYDPTTVDVPKQYYRNLMDNYTNMVKDYKNIFKLAQEVKFLLGSEKIKYPNGLKIDRNTVRLLFKQWIEKYSKIFHISPENIIMLENNIEKVLNYYELYIDNTNDLSKIIKVPEGIEQPAPDLQPAEQTLEDLPTVSHY